MASEQHDPGRPAAPAATPSLRSLQIALRSERLFGGLAGELSRIREAARDAAVSDDLDKLRARRPSGSLAEDWADRIDTLGDLALDSRARRAAFPEMVEAFSLPSLEQVIVNKQSWCALDQHAISMAGQLFRGNRLVATWHREVLLDAGVAIHHLLMVDPAFRGTGVAPALLDQGLELYDRLGLQVIVLNAALETGRWHWARCGFEFNPDDAALVRAYFDAAVSMLGLPIDTSGFRTASEFAMAAPEVTVSMARLSSLAGLEGGRRIRELAAANDIDFYAEIPAAKAIMLTGPPWGGHLLLQGPQRPVFDVYVQSRLEAARRLGGQHPWLSCQ